MNAPTSVAGADDFAQIYSSSQTESYSASSSTFPSLLFTVFDEQNPLPGLGTGAEGV